MAASKSLRRPRRPAGHPNVAIAAPASATTILLSDVGSDGTPASALGAEIHVDVVASTLTLTVGNTSSEFDVNRIYWNASAAVSGLTFSSATHSVVGDVAAAWLPLETHERAGASASSTSRSRCRAAATPPA